ncbi:Na(+)-translocating NADH-quinone reductase subunit F [Pseudoalteromonas holothuriae]|uniref:Na(+)-translocating NADH-quinone reductase subunit F n=1 Tax=Pseudoalteromonas holothuriae TaxID=2963714 RepID=A0ABM9GDL9_9GAMM|nr:2Fe-2S iron-sulfur cluster-binding protein [Pseudoalteromonas sp. CIP111951]CAH9051151.1 Na(+)-translocating NADH-quinone reductase subunit F [Pseudoalteromonas sp. CIP111951]
MFKLNKTLHKWLSLFVGLQLLIWLITGLYFNLMDHKKGAGNANLRTVVHRAKVPHTSLIPLQSLAIKPVQSIKLLWILGHPYYQIIEQAGAHRYQTKVVYLLDAQTGTPAPLNETLARTIALKSFKEAVNITEARLLEPPIAALPKEQNPLWQVTLNDANNTHIYIEHSSGQVIAHVNDDRRLRDLAFKLHFMDYMNTGGFNHWLIIIFAITTLVLSLTGATWLVERFKAGQLSLIFKHHKKSVTVTELTSQQTHTLALETKSSLFDGLIASGIQLPSSCGGGGTCGLCKVRCKSVVNATSADKARLSDAKLEQGYRLACEHNAGEVTDIEVRAKLIRCDD